MLARGGLVAFAFLWPAIAIGQHDPTLYATSVIAHSLAMAPASLDAEQAKSPASGTIFPGDDPSYSRLVGPTAPLSSPTGADHWALRQTAASPRGVLLVAYIGLPGTFEDNRPHFLSLLTSLQQ